MNRNDRDYAFKKAQPEMDIEIVRLASDGTGVGFLNGKTTFVRGMLPGEKGKVRIVENKKNFQRAEASEITELSPQRQTPPCSIYHVCGGCDLQHMKYAYSLEWKRQWVEDALRRIGAIQDVKVEPVSEMEEPWRYRNKAVLHRDQDGRFGYYKEKTKEVTAFDDCLLLSQMTNMRIRKFQEAMGDSIPGISTATLRESNRGKGMLILDGNTKEDREVLEHEIKALKELEIFSPQVCSVIIPQENRRGKDFEGSGALHLNEYIDEIRFRVSPRAFLQVNPIQTEKLYRLVLDWANLTGKEQVWDLYCGIGTITLMLAKQAGEIIGIEENPHAVEDAVENAKDNNIRNVRFIQGKVEDKIKGLSHAPDLIVTDPPRAGMEPLVIRRILEMKPKKIIYVSCNPATLARDIKLLVQEDGGSYNIERVQPVDMFPWTGHVETVVLMSRVDK